MAVDTAKMVRIERNKLHGRILRDRLLKGAVCFLLGMFIAGLDIDGMFGAAVAFVGAAGPGVFGFASLLGAELGYLVFYGLTGSMQYMAAGIMVYTVSFVFQYLSVSRRNWFMPITVMAVTGLTVAYGSVSVVQYELPGMAVILREIALCGALTAVYKSALAFGPYEGTCSIPVCYARLVLLGSVCNAFYGLEIGGYLSPGRCAAIYAAMCAAYFNEMSVAVSGAALLGMGCDCSVLLGVSAFAAKQWGNGKKLLFGTVFVAAAVLCLPGSVPLRDIQSYIYDFCVGGVLFFINEKLGAYVYAAAEQSLIRSREERALRSREAQRLCNMAAALDGLSARFTDCGDTAAESEVLAALDRSMDTVCSTCGKRNTCRSSQRVDMLYLFMSVQEAVESRGRMLETDLPDIFRERCYAYKSLVLAVNYELLYQTACQQRRETARETSAMAGKAYTLFADMLRAAAENMGVAVPDSLHKEVSVERYLRQRKLRCEVSVYYGSMKRLCIEIRGADVGKLTSGKRYLEELSELLGVRLCAELIAKDCLTLFEAEPLAVSVGIAGRRKQGERVSGDRVRQFKTTQGLFYILLSDGMGTGADAEAQSAGVIADLEALLRGGITAECAMETVNQLMCFRNQEEWDYATLDLLELDLFTGRAAIYKYGGADSFLYDGSKVTAVTGQSLPVGMESGVKPDRVVFQMRPGMVGLMVSDGVALTAGAQLEKVLQEEKRNMKVLSRQILLTDAADKAGDDDMTAIAFSLEVRK